MKILEDLKKNQRMAIRSMPILAFVVGAASLSGCSSVKAPSTAIAYEKQYTVTPKTGSAPAQERDGPPTEVPANLADAPDATPQVVNIKSGGPNKPYSVAGVSYSPITKDLKIKEKGLASWYGKKYHGRRTSTGEVYDMFSASAAHKTMPLPSYARVTNPKNGKSVVVRVNDRGPFIEGRIIDLSYLAAMKIGLLKGVQEVFVERLTNDEITK